MSETKLQDALRQEIRTSLKIFISHKGKDCVAAEKIAKILKKYGSTNVDIFVSERISPGIPWAAEIYENLKAADWLLLLYTDPSEEWDWCLFEAGFFAGSIKNSEKRLICLHTLEDPPPLPLQGWQTVPITDEIRIEEFLRLLFGRINPDLVKSNEDTQEVADEIAKAFQVKVRRRVRTKWHTHYLTLSMNAAQVEDLVKIGRVPSDVVCGLKEKESLNIFGYGTGECTVEKLEKGLEEHYRDSWLKALGESLRAACLNRSPLPRIPVLYSPSIRAEYHVILHCYHQFSDGSMEFYLLFIERIPESEMGHDRELQKLGNMLKLGRAFRWKVLTKFKRQIEVLMQRSYQQDKIEYSLENLKFAMDWVIGESQRLDILTPNDVVQSFQSNEDIQAIDNAMKNIWPKLFQDLYAGIENADLAVVRDALAEMLQANKDYMIRAARRYAELMESLL